MALNDESTLMVLDRGLGAQMIACSSTTSRTRQKSQQRNSASDRGAIGLPRERQIY
jgi:hypothetical protein